MAVNANDILATLSPERRARIEAEGQRLIAQEQAFQDLRKALIARQTDQAQGLGVEFEIMATYPDGRRVQIALP